MSHSFKSGLGDEPAYAFLSVIRLKACLLFAEAGGGGAPAASLPSLYGHGDRWKEAK